MPAAHQDARTRNLLFCPRHIFRVTLMIRFAAALVLVTALAGGLTGCQTTSNIAPHFEGEKWKRLPSASQVQIRRIPTDNLKAHPRNMAKQGYGLIGKARFRGEQESIEQLKAFAASVGADLVEANVAPLGTAQRTYMGVSSYTPGRVVTSYGTSSGYASGSGSGTLYSPYGAMPFNTSGSATAYGSSTATTYIPSQTTYAPMSYEVLITEQTYLFWASPKQFLRQWLDSAKKYNTDMSLEDTKQNAAIYAQAWGVPLPRNLRPKEPVPQLPEKDLAQTRSLFLKTWETSIR